MPKNSREENGGCVGKSQPRPSLQMTPTGWERRAVLGQLNIPAASWSWRRATCRHPETAVHWCQPPACNYLTASPPTKAKQLTLARADECAIQNPLMSNVDGAPCESRTLCSKQIWQDQKRKKKQNVGLTSFLYCVWMSVYDSLFSSSSSKTDQRRERYSY